MRRLLQSRILGAVVMALILAVIYASPFGQRFERDWGLSSLYTLRGPVEVPTEAMVVALEQKSVNWMQFHAPDLERVAPSLASCLTPHSRDALSRIRNIGDMPRGIHACLIDELVRRGARLVVYDILFHIETPDDPALAAAIEHAGNVILFERIRVDSEQQLRSSDRPIPQRVHPREVFAQHAAGVGSFLVNAPTGNFVDGYVTRLPEFPDLPAVPEIAIAQWHGANPAADPEGVRPLWLYGPPRTIPTRTLRDIFEEDSGNPLPQDMRNVAVFIGVSDPEFLGTKDHFKVPISDARQNDIGGVELAATAFLNRLHGERMRRPGHGTAILMVGLFGLVTVLAARGLAGGRGMWAVGTMGAVWVAGTWVAFVTQHAWLPFAVPIYLGLPAAVLVALATRYLFARRLVGTLAPRQVAHTMMDATDPTRRQIKSEQATIMFTDLVGSTALGDRLSGESYGRLMNHYYDRATLAVEGARGMVVEFMGDGILAVFSESVTGKDHARRACEAAKALSNTIRANGATEPSLPEQDGAPVRLQLRMGLNTGLTSTGDIGAEHRFNYKAMGDTVNTAARLEQLGKALDAGDGDVILVSEATYEASGLPDEAVEHLGAFTLRGKAEPISVLRLRENE